METGCEIRRAIRNHDFCEAMNLIGKNCRSNLPAHLKIFGWLCIPFNPTITSLSLRFDFRVWN
eukprot:m.239172 g.239172  ORF g.239172 m.239172 type:complete len:63 (+) comp19404_c0_seq19:1002-1190(+)